MPTNVETKRRFAKLIATSYAKYLVEDTHKTDTDRVFAAIANAIIKVYPTAADARSYSSAWTIWCGWTNTRRRDAIGHRLTEFHAGRAARAEFERLQTKGVRRGR